MGGCFSVTAFEPSLHSSSPTAKVVSANGSLIEYPVPVSVSQVLTLEKAASPSSSTASFFVCNSDRFNYDSYIPALVSDHQLEADQIYFVLPVAKLQRRLTASDMAALAVRASLALQNASTASSSGKKDRTRRRNKNRVSPILVVKSEPRSEYDFVDYEADFTIGPSNSLMKKKVMAPEKAALGVSRSGSVRKLQRYSSKRVLKRAVRSFKLRLTPIQEGTEVF
ncbi:uncharacterized protein LOC133743600 [Rosa rugosa]|uniref:uncharacterized protein LOC133743600 n=1 Tax=Rosa rugosa TaxID=74645 RepID=UPI002B40203B|nr:uncharacterized protein LOC133743600 [Rosa rugosa]